MLERTQLPARRDESLAAVVAAVDERNVRRLATWLPPQAAETRALLSKRGLPLRVGETSAAFGALALCLGPQEWWLVSREHEPLSISPHVESELAAEGLMIADLTEGLAVLEVHGRSTRDLLSKACGLDFHPRVFGVGRCARTRFAQIPAVLFCRDDSHRFELYVARSYAHYVQAYLTDLSPCESDSSGETPAA
jgi:sarcosine oxidase subunit gamma